ncbi:class I SAM-dependent methyltransferase [Patulibacter americanus]|uniref:class I SAM-dependent methyltransferase n=1 Tax=Patulibacter americanus TaxID=588672 RepID=UPI0003B50084|nr:class I SAM-dependent methyltransferase [Patulibacter americanus]
MNEHDHQIGLHGLALLRAGVKGDALGVHRHRSAITDLLNDPSDATSRVLPEVSVQEGYAAWATSYDERRNASIRAEEPVVRELLQGRTPGVAVDVGTGTGRHATWLAAQGHRVTGIDTSRAMLEVARSRAPELEWIEADLRALPLPDACADIVVCGLTLSHLPTLVGIAELARLLRPGGRLVVSNPHPLATDVLHARAWTTTADGIRVQVPEWAHGLGEYVARFVAAGLVPTVLQEPPHDGEDPMLQGMPAAVVWAADRPEA